MNISSFLCVLHGQIMNQSSVVCTVTTQISGTVKSKVHPRTGHQGPEGKCSYNCTLSLISALDGVGGQRHSPAASSPRQTRYPLYRRLGEP